MHGDAVHAVADFSGRDRQVLRVETFRDRLPRRAAIIGAECAGGRNRDIQPIVALGIDEDGVQAEAARTRRPLRAGAVAAQRGELGPARAAVARFEQRGILDPGVHRVWIRQRRLEMPHALELPWVRRAVVPLVGARDSLVEKLVADRFPGLPAVAAARHRLAEPVTGLGGIDAVRIDGRSFQVVDLPAAEAGCADLPVPPRSVRGENERALARADENSYSAHSVSNTVIRARDHTRRGGGTYRRDCRS